MGLTTTNGWLFFDGAVEEEFRRDDRRIANIPVVQDSHNLTSDKCDDNG